MSSYDPPDTLDAGRPLYDQIGKPERAAVDIAGRSPGGAKRGLEYVNQQRLARSDANTQNAARIGGITERQRTTRELNEAKERVDAYYGTQAEHKAFKGPAKRAEEASRLRRLTDAIEAHRAARAQDLKPKLPLPSDRDQIIYQESVRLAPPANLSKRRASIENRATSMLLDPNMATAGAFAARKAPRGFKPSDQVARRVGYGALGAGATAAIAAPTALYSALADNDRKVKRGVDEYMADKMKFPDDPVKAENAWKRLSWGDRVRVQNTLNSINVRQIEPDGGWGSQTKTAVEEAQIALGLPVTGVLDNQTLKALNEAHDRRVYEWERKSKQGQ
jgi:peptidoglycan hydrolase-like protein with peptidoglycan-binding domain